MLLFRLTYCVYYVFLSICFNHIFFSSVHYVAGPRPSQSTEQQEDALLTAFNAARSDSSYSISAVTCLRDLLGKK